MRLTESAAWRASLAFCSYLFLGHILLAVNAAAPGAISVPIDDAKWIGCDGSWSPVNVQIGTPVQAVDLFPSIAGQETLVVGLQGCDGTIECRNLRGGLFAANESSSFESIGEYDLGLDPQLGFNGTGYYGLDSISFSDVAPLSGQVLAIVNSTEYWTGLLGLGVDNTTIAKTQASSYLASLATGDTAQIPSLSYGYTAGASYRLKQVPSSLTLGGYDANRFVPNNATFTLGSNQQPVLAINSVALNGLSDGNLTVLDATEQDLFVIDSTTPYLWFPDSVASKIEQALGLKYNDTLGLYLYQNTSQYQKLMDAEFSFDFVFAELPGAVNILTLSIPSKAFTTLNLTFGYPGLTEDETAAPIPYFPLRKAANSAQYTIGRAFLQETYLTVDYERNNFSLSQAKFSLDASVNMAITDIPSASTNNSTINPQPSNTQSKSLSTGMVAGIAIGVIALMAIVTGTLTLLYLRRPRAPQPEEAKILELPARECQPYDQDKFYTPNEKGTVSELSATQMGELPTSPDHLAPVELPGSIAFQSEYRNSISKHHRDNDQSAPRPLQAVHSHENEVMDLNRPASAHCINFSRLPPSYSPSARSIGTGLSPNSAEGTYSLGPIEVSPLDSLHQYQTQKVLLASSTTLNTAYGTRKPPDETRGVDGLAPTLSESSHFRPAPQIMGAAGRAELEEKEVEKEEKAEKKEEEEERNEGVPSKTKQPARKRFSWE